MEVDDAGWRVQPGEQALDAAAAFLEELGACPPDPSSISRPEFGLLFARIVAVAAPLVPHACELLPQWYHEGAAELASRLSHTFFKVMHGMALTRLADLEALRYMNLATGGMEVMPLEYYVRCVRLVPSKFPVGRDMLMCAHLYTNKMSQVGPCWK
jgi:hypothetical protein